MLAESRLGILIKEMASMPHERISIQPPDYLTKELEDAAGPWKSKGLMVQWGPYGEHDGSPAVGISTGDFVDNEDDVKRVNGGGGKLEDAMMLWFNRAQLNKVISLLRRARNSAYGADE
jgi:hypothetical protein